MRPEKMFVFFFFQKDFELKKVLVFSESYTAQLTSLKCKKLGFGDPIKFAKGLNIVNNPLFAILERTNEKLG